jgi:hypothetical protein
MSDKLSGEKIGNVRSHVLVERSRRYLIEFADTLHALTKYDHVSKEEKKVLLGKVMAIRKTAYALCDLRDVLTPSNALRAWEKGQREAMKEWIKVMERNPQIKPKG